MSMDFKPYQQYLADKHLNHNLRNSSLIWLVNGERIPLHDNSFLKAELPELYFLFESGTQQLYDTFKDDYVVLGYLRQAEAYIVEVENELNSIVVSRQNSAALLDEGKTFDLEDEQKEYTLREVIRAWFMGNLDKNFYYNTYNNELLLNYMSSHCRCGDK